MSEVKNIIFDLGGVIFDIDYNRTIEAFRNLGIEDAGFLYSKSSQISLFDDLEKGNISDLEFYDGIRKLSKKDLSDEQIRDAWNAILIGLPEKNVAMLKELKNTYRIFLLSNTNNIHEQAYRKMVIEQYGSFIFDELFEKMYLSHHIQMRKPDREIFNFVLNDNNLSADQTIFIDDSPQHVKGAIQTGIGAYLLKQESITDFISSKLNIKAGR